MNARTILVAAAMALIAACTSHDDTPTNNAQIDLADPRTGTSGINTPDPNAMDLNGAPDVNIGTDLNAVSPPETNASSAGASNAAANVATNAL